MEARIVSGFGSSETISMAIVWLDFFIIFYKVRKHLAKPAPFFRFLDILKQSRAKGSRNIVASRLTIWGWDFGFVLGFGFGILKLNCDMFIKPDFIMLPRHYNNGACGLVGYDVAFTLQRSRVRISTGPLLANFY